MVQLFWTEKTYPLEEDQDKILVYPVFLESIESIINLDQCFVQSGQLKLIKSD